MINEPIAGIACGLGGYLSWLKRIPPLEELEGEKREEKEPA